MRSFSFWKKQKTRLLVQLLSKSFWLLQQFTKSRENGNFSPFTNFSKRLSIRFQTGASFSTLKMSFSSLVISNVESLIYEAKSRYYLMAFHIVNIHREFGQRVHQKAIEKKK